MFSISVLLSHLLEKTCYGKVSNSKAHLHNPGQHQLTCLFSSLAEMFSFALSLKCLSPLFETKKDNSLLHLKACVGGNLGILSKTKYEAGEGHSECTVNI